MAETHDALFALLLQRYQEERETVLNETSIHPRTDRRELDAEIDDWRRRWNGAPAEPGLPHAVVAPGATLLLYQPLDTPLHGAVQAIVIDNPDDPGDGVRVDLRYDGLGRYAVRAIGRVAPGRLRHQG